MYCNPGNSRFQAHPSSMCPASCLPLAGLRPRHKQTHTVGIAKSLTLFVVNANSRAEAQAFVDGDPFTQAGYFTDMKITRLRKGLWNPEAMEGV